MTERPHYAPGCFGSSIHFKADEICGACAYAAECEPVHRRAKAQLQDFFGIQVKTPTRASGALPVKVKHIFDEAGKSEQEVRDAIQNGQNPYPLKEGFLGIVCHLILSFPGIQRPAIAEALGRSRQLNRETSNTYARFALQILAHCGAVTLEGDEIKPIRG